MFPHSEFKLRKWSIHTLFEWSHGGALQDLCRISAGSLQASCHVGCRDKEIEEPRESDSPQPHCVSSRILHLLMEYWVEEEMGGETCNIHTRSPLLWLVKLKEVRLNSAVPTQTHRAAVLFQADEFPPAVHHFEGVKILLFALCSAGQCQQHGQRAEEHRSCHRSSCRLTKWTQFSSSWR